MSEVLSIYTPSNLKPEILEEIFVQRHKLLEKSVQWVEESIVTKKKNHLLFVGSRGSGKTHLISMIINRLKAKEELKSKMVLVWLGEDDVITNFLDFVLSILRTMAEDSEFNFYCLEVAKGKGHKEAVDIILDGIMQQIGDRILLVVKENMSDVFSGLKDDGQKKLRAFLQEKKNMVLLTSSQQLFEGVSSRDAAFFGFFDIHHLEPLSVEDAMELIAKVSKLKGDQELFDFIHTSQGRYRVRALHHLAGGNQRLYMNLLEFLTMESLDNLVSALNKLADDLTPYFQERIKALPPQQGKIVQKLCDIEGALPVKSIAEELFIGERSVAKQLGELRNKNYVLAYKRGKQTYYEIAEPLMRLSLEVKHNHGKPLKMLVLLLRAWFSDKELKDTLNTAINELLDEYMQEALNMDKDILHTLSSKISKKLVSCAKLNDYQGVITYASEILGSPELDKEKLSMALSLRAVAYLYNGDFSLVIKDCEKVILIDVIDENTRITIYYILAIAYGKSKHYNNAIVYFSRCLDLENIPKKIQINSLKKRAEVYQKIQNTSLAISDYTTIITLDDLDNKYKLNALVQRFHLYIFDHKVKQALKDINKVIDIQDISDDKKASSLVLRGMVYGVLSEHKKAINDYIKVLALPNILMRIQIIASVSLTKEYYGIHEFVNAHNSLQNTFQFRESEKVKEEIAFDDTLVVIAKLGLSQWEQEVKFLLPLFAKYKAMEYLSESLIHSIKVFLENDVLLPLFNKWQELWQEEAADYVFMQVPLKILRVVRTALEEKSDKPLFELPKEIRDLVLPLIEDAIK